MNTHTNRQPHHCGRRVFSWLIAFALVFSLVAVPASAESGTYSAELVFSMEGMDISGKLALDTDNLLLGVIAGIGSGGATLMDAAVYLGLQAIVADSALIGGAYGFDLSSIKENLPKSIFAPDSGSSYALDQETYDQVMDILNQDFTQIISDDSSIDTSAVGEAASVLAEALTESASQVASMLTMETANATEIVNGVAVDASLMRITADSQALIASAEAFVTTIQSSSESQSALALILDSLSTAGMDTGYTGAEIVEVIVQDGDALMEEVRTSIQESNVSLSILASLSNTTSSPVKLSLELEADGSVLTFNVLIGEEFDFFRVEMLEDGQIGPAFQFEMYENAQDVGTFKFSLWDGTVEEASMALELDVANQTFQLNLVSDGDSSSVSGYFTTGEGLFSLVVDQLDGQEFGGTVALNLRSNDTISLPAFTEISTMTEEELNALVEKTSETFQALSQMFG